MQRCQQHDVLAHAAMAAALDVLVFTGGGENSAPIQAREDLQITRETQRP
jgi:acetate kinase